MVILNDLNLRKQAEELGVDVWHAPSFLFLMMGIITIIIMLANYYISVNQSSPELLVVSESVIVVTIFIIGNSIIESVEQIARVNRLKSEFVSVASHQLRSPLSAIRWETELLLSKYSEGLNEKQLDGIETIGALTARMVRLISDLLDVARIDQGRLALKKSNVDISQIIDDSINNLSLLARAKNISIFFKPKENLPLVVGDKERLKMVVDNLLSNSIKYIAGRGRVEIGLYVADEFLVFNIKDNGVGIPREQQRQIFSKFFRSDNAIKYQTDGTGLGLYIAKNIIEQLGGKIWFESREGVGSVFSFSLPIAS